MQAMSHTSSVGVVLPSTAPKAIIAEAAQKAASMTSGRSRVMADARSCQ
jgi:hypothetical protein